MGLCIELETSVVLKKDMTLEEVNESNPYGWGVGAYIQVEGKMLVWKIDNEKCRYCHEIIECLQKIAAEPFTVYYRDENMDWKDPAQASVYSPT